MLGALLLTERGPLGTMAQMGNSYERWLLSPSGEPLGTAAQMGTLMNSNFYFSLFTVHFSL